MEAIVVELKIRKTGLILDEIHTEGGRPAAKPWRMAVAYAVIENPYAGRYEQDLNPMIDAFCPRLGELLGPRVVQALGGRERIEAFGKGALVGLTGEIEHGSALIHSLRFGDPFRNAAGGTALLPAVEKRGESGASIDIPLKHKADPKVRSHHQTFEVRVPDAPHPGEIIVFCAAADSGRPHARIGSLHRELEAKGETVE
jgi:hypothetical protein